MRTPSPLWVLGTLVAGGGLVLLALLWIEIDSAELGRGLLARAGERAGLRIEAEGFRWNLASGLELDRVEARAGVRHGRLELAAHRLTFKHRLLPLASDRF